MGWWNVLGWRCMILREVRLVVRSLHLSTRIALIFSANGWCQGQQNLPHTRHTIPRLRVSSQPPTPSQPPQHRSLTIRYITLPINSTNTMNYFPLYNFLLTLLLALALA